MRSTAGNKEHDICLQMKDGIQNQNQLQVCHIIILIIIYQATTEKAEFSLTSYHNLLVWVFPGSKEIVD